MARVHRRSPGRLRSAPLIEAGEAALRRGSWAEARRLFERALARDETAEALEGLAWAEWWSDRPLESFAARERAYRLYQRRGDRRAAARIALAMAVDSIDYRGEPAVGRGWIERGRRLLIGLERTPEFGWAMLWTGHWARIVEHDVAEAERYGLKASAIGRKLKLVDLEMMGVSLQALTLIDRGRVDEGMRRLDEAMTAALSGDMMALDAIGQTCCFLMHACNRVHDYERAIQWCGRVQAFCDRWKVTTLFTICRTHYAAVLISRGEWRRAERELKAACAQEQTRPYVARAAWVQLGELRRRQGRVAEAQRLFARAEGHPLALLGRAALALDAGRSDEAAELAERFVDTVPGDIPMELAAGLELLIHAFVARQRVADAEATAVRLRGLARTLDIPAMRAVVRSADAALAAARGDREAAQRGYRQAGDLFSRSGMPFESRMAETRARAIASKSPAEPDAPRPRGGPSLSPRERDVLKLVAQGLNDRAVAAKLRLSAHTVHRHLANIRVKLDVSSRSAAVARAVRDALI